MSQAIYRSGCWGCLKSQQDPTEKYICPKLSEHQAEYEKCDGEFN